MFALDAVTAVSNLTTLKSVVQEIIGMFADILGRISVEPLLLIGVGVFLVSAVIYLTYKALHGRG